jgi:hypothetical protein
MTELCDARPAPAEASESLIAAAPAMYRELLAAHQLLVLALGCMTRGSREQFALQSEVAGLGTDGATRHHERLQVLARAAGAHDGSMSLDIHSPEHQRRLREADEADAQDQPDGGEYGDTEMAGIVMLGLFFIVAPVAIVALVAGCAFAVLALAG